MVAYATSRPLYSFKPETRRRRSRTWPTAPADLGRRQDHHGQDQARASSTRPPVNREVTTADIKYAIERPSRQRAERLRGAYFGDIDGAPDEADRRASRPSRGITDAGQHDARLQAQRATAALARGAGDAGHACRCRRSTRRSSTRRTRRPTTSTWSSPARTWSRTTGASSRAASPGKQIKLVRNPNWDKSTDFRPAYLDASTSRRATATRPSPRARSLAGHGRCCSGDGAPPAPVLKQALDAEQGPVHVRPRRRHPLHRAQHHVQAVRQPQRPQGARRRHRPQRAAPDARRRDDRGRSPRASSRRASPASTRRAASSRPGLDFLPSQRRPGADQEVHAGGQVHEEGRLTRTASTTGRRSS